MEENTNKKTMEEMMAENLQLTREIHKMTKSVKSYVAFQRILGVFYLLIIVVPLILSIIYLPPLLNNVIGQYQDLLGGNQSTNNIKNPPSMQGLLEQAQKFLNENNN